MRIRHFLLNSAFALLVVGFALALVVDPLQAAEAEAEAASSSLVPADWRAFLAPFHSVFLHLPIGFVTIALILEVYSLFRPGESLRRAIGLVLWVSAASAILVTTLGIFRAAGGGYEEAALKFHRYSGIAVAVVTTLVALLHVRAFPAKANRRGKLAFAYRVMLFFAVGLISVAGHYGGNLTHGSKYLFEGAPEWVKNWAEEADETLTSPFKDDTSSGDTDSPDESDVGSGIYAEVIRPVLEDKCFQCHGEEKQKGDYRMDTIDGLFAAGESEIDPIVPGRPLESYLVEVISLPLEDDYVMPPEGKEALTPEETLILIRWIWDGADTGQSDKAGEDGEADVVTADEEAEEADATGDR